MMPQIPASPSLRPLDRGSHRAGRPCSPNSGGAGLGLGVSPPSGTPVRVTVG